MGSNVNSFARNKTLFVIKLIAHFGANGSGRSGGSSDGGDYGDSCDGD